MSIVRETPHFILQELSEGVFAAVAKPGQGAWSNSGFVDLGAELVVFDTFNTPAAAEELKRQAENLTGKKAAYVVNSHYHGDHVFGNQAFADAVIVSTRATREWFEEKNIMGNPAEEQKETAAYLAVLQKQISAAEPGIRRESLINQHLEMEQLLADLHRLKMVKPALVFEKRLTIHGAKRRVELQCFSGHTASDAVMYVPDAGVLFAGDLVTENLHVPVTDPPAFRAALEALAKLEAETFVPGHGNVGTKDLLPPLADYLDLLIDSSRGAAVSGKPVEEFISAFQVPAEYHAWRGINGMERNLKTAYEFFALQNKD